MKKQTKVPNLKYWDMERVIWYNSFSGILFSNLGLISVAESLEVVERYISPPLPNEIVKQPQQLLPGKDYFLLS